MENDFLKGSYEEILRLGLGSLSHANRHSIYAPMENEKWPELSILQAAHAAELFIKARIAQEHPLLIIDKFPKINKENKDMSYRDLIVNSKTIQWHQLLDRLYICTGKKIKHEDIFLKIGNLRNNIQHLGIYNIEQNFSDITLEFIFKVIDPFINENWNLYAMDFDEEDESYLYLPNALISREIPFLVSDEGKEYFDEWKDSLEKCSEEYKKGILFQIG